MRIALIGPAYPYRGGIAQATDNLARELRRSHAVRVITFSRQYPTLLFPGTSDRAISPARESLAGEELLDSLDPRSWMRVGNELAGWKPDLVLFMWWHPFFGPAFGWLTRRLKKVARARLGFLCHNARPHEFTPGAEWASRYALAAGDFHVVMSDTVARELTSLLPGAQPARAILPHDFVLAGDGALTREQARAKLGIAPQDKVALMFGMVRKYKGLDVLLSALAGTPDVKLIVAGEFYEPVAAYESLVKRFGLAGRVTFLNRYVPDAEAPLYLLAADVLAAPYTSASQSGVLPQARAAGLPIIASDFDGLTQNFEPGVTGLVVPPSDSGALADAFRRFFAPGAAESFRQAMKQSGEAGSWSEFAGVVLEAHLHCAARSAAQVSRARTDSQPAGRFIAPAGARRLNWRVCAEAIVLVLSGAFIARTLWQSASELQALKPALRWWPLAVALCIELSANLMLAFGWWLVLRKTGVVNSESRFTFLHAARIRASSQLARYIPGNIWHLLGRLSMSDHAGLPVDRVGVGMVLEEGLVVLSGIAVSLLTLPFWLPANLRAQFGAVTGWLFVFLLLPVGLIALHPRILQLGVNLGCRIIQRPPAELSLRYRDVLLLFAYYTAGRFAMASAAYFVVAAFYPLSPAALPAIIGMTMLAWSVGYLSFLTPTGLGVREATLLILLKGLVPLPIAGVAVLVARLVSLLGEVALAGLMRVPFFNANNAQRRIARIEDKIGSATRAIPDKVSVAR